MSFLLNIAPLAFFIFIWLFFMGRMGGGGGIGGGVFSVGKSKARVYGKENSVGVTFKDVAGQIGAKQEVQEIVEFLKNPGKYRLQLFPVDFRGLYHKRFHFPKLFLLHSGERRQTRRLLSYPALQL